MKTLFRKIILALALAGLTASINLNGMKRKFDEIENEENCNKKNMKLENAKITKTEIRPFYKKYLEIYDELSSNNEWLEKFRSSWQPDKVSTETKIESGKRPFTFKDDASIEAIIKIADKLRKHYSDAKTEIYSLGQSPIHIVLTAQILEALDNQNPSRYGFIAFSGIESPPDFCLDFTFETFKEAIASYYLYLKEINLITQQQKTVVIVEQVESGACVTAFNFILDKIKELKLLKDNEYIPSIKWYVFKTNENARHWQEAKNNQLKFTIKCPSCLEESIVKGKQTSSFTAPNGYMKIITHNDVFDCTMGNNETQKCISGKGIKYLPGAINQKIQSIITKYEDELKISMNDIKITIHEEVIKDISPFDVLQNIDDTKHYPLNECHATWNKTFRLIEEYKPINWKSINPSLFIPHKDAEIRALRIIDYIKQQQEKESTEKEIDKKE